MVKRLPAMRETQVQSLGWENLLEKEMATHSSILAWKIPWTEEPRRLQSTESQSVGHNWATSLSLSWSCIWRLLSIQNPSVVLVDKSGLHPIWKECRFMWLKPPSKNWPWPEGKDGNDDRSPTGSVVFSRSLGRRHGCYLFCLPQRSLLVNQPWLSVCFI